MFLTRTDEILILIRVKEKITEFPLTPQRTYNECNDIVDPEQYNLRFNFWKKIPSFQKFKRIP